MDGKFVTDLDSSDSSNACGSCYLQVVFLENCESELSYTDVSNGIFCSDS